MSEPLFLQSVMQEKIWGGTKLRDEFGYDIPSEKIGEYWAISAHPNGVSKVANGRFEGTDQLLCMRNTVNCLATVQNLYFHS